MNLNLAHTPEQQLYYARESIADAIRLGMDSAGGFSARLTDALPGLITGFRELVKFKATKPLENLSSDQRKFVRLLEDHMYGELRYIQTHVPEGFNGKYLDLLNVLEHSTANCINVEQETLAPYVTFLAGFAVGGNVVRSMDNQAAKWKAVNDDRDEINADYAKLFSGRDTRKPYSQVVERNLDWTKIFQLSTKVHGEMKGINYAVITDSCRKAETYLELIERNIKAGKLQDATPEVCLALSEGAYQIARMIEFISITHYRVMTAFTAIDRTVEHVRSVIKA
jgi:hypothetical protein